VCVSLLVRDGLDLLAYELKSKTQVVDRVSLFAVGKK
jgi:hypothetical protein